MTAHLITIRPATGEDLDALVRLLDILFALESDFTVNADKQRQGLRLMLMEAWQRVVLVAESDGEVLGMCTAQMVISTAEGGPAAWVEDMVVAPEYRNSGIGRRLLQGIVDWAGERGISRLQLVADRNNAPALGFYDHEGWMSTNLVCRRKVISQVEIGRLGR
jgi:GNAT superfamily N-acetyltransferase